MWRNGNLCYFNLSKSYLHIIWQCYVICLPYKLLRYDRRAWVIVVQVGTMLAQKSNFLLALILVYRDCVIQTSCGGIVQISVWYITRLDYIQTMQHWPIDCVTCSLWVGIFTTVNKPRAKFHNNLIRLKYFRPNYTHFGQVYQEC